MFLLLQHTPEKEDLPVSSPCPKPWHWGMHLAGIVSEDIWTHICPISAKRAGFCLHSHVFFQMSSRSRRERLCVVSGITWESKTIAIFLAHLEVNIWWS